VKINLIALAVVKLWKQEPGEEPDNITPETRRIKVEQVATVFLFTIMLNLT